jgi:hypothetical protein
VLACGHQFGVVYVSNEIRAGLNVSQYVAMVANSEGAHKGSEQDHSASINSAMNSKARGGVGGG